MIFAHALRVALKLQMATKKSNRSSRNMEERTPVAFTNAGGHVRLVDSDAVLLDKPESASFDLPVITGLESIASLDECRTRIALYQDFMRQLGEEISHSGWMVSEADLGDGDDLKALLVQGRDTLQVHFGHENFLEHFHTFLALLPELRKSNGALALRWHGPAQVEFMVDRQAKRACLLEINGRFWGTLGLSIAAGINFPLLACRMALEGDVEPCFRYQSGLRYRWPWPFGILDTLGRGHRWPSFREFFGPSRGTQSDLWFSDPLPHLAEIAFAAGRLYKRKSLRSAQRATSWEAV